MMDKYQFVHSPYYLENFNILNYSCPVCNSSDRERLYSLYLRSKFEQMIKTNNTYTFLDIAPSTSLSKWIKKHPSIQYKSVDLYMANVDDKADITDLKIYEDDKFDIIICSHVLEHVENDRKAMTELFRVLRPKGFAIVMVLILLSLQEDLENPEWSTEADRWKYYGQNDHVRMYSKSGFVNKLKETGFKVSQLGIDFFQRNPLRNMVFILGQFYMW
jgi:ubiquinone/menaquinone biosynthesis C-methylase UbiE